MQQKRFRVHIIKKEVQKEKQGKEREGGYSGESTGDSGQNLFLFFHGS